MTKGARIAALVALLALLGGGAYSLSSQESDSQSRPPPNPQLRSLRAWVLGSTR